MPFTALRQGRKRRLFWKNFTPATNHVAPTLTTRKDLTARLLRDTGPAAPRNAIVPDVAAAGRVADPLGYPVVVKPVPADHGRGVSIGIGNAEQLRAAFARAAEHGPVLVEEQIPGDHHRLLVMHGRCITVSRRLPARIVGDGLATVAAMLGGEEADWADTVIGEWFPSPARGRIPLVVVLGRVDTPERMSGIGKLLHEDMAEIAVVSAQAVRLGTMQSRGPASPALQGEAALGDPIPLPPRAVTIATRSHRRSSFEGR